MSTALQKCMLLALVVWFWPARTPAGGQVEGSGAKLTVIREGKLTKEPVTERISIPANFGGLEVTLAIQPPNLDTNLYVFDSDPNAATWVPPRCTSESLSSPKVCLVGRPSSGEVWVVVQYYESQRIAEYRLSGRFIPKDEFEALSAPEVKPGGDALGSEAQVFRVNLRADETAVVVLNGQDRPLSVQDETGTKYQLYKTRSGSLFVPLGKPLNESTTVLGGENKPKRFFIRVGPGKGPTSLGAPGRALLMVLRTPDFSRSPYLVPFPQSAVKKERLVVPNEGAAEEKPEHTGNVEIQAPVIYSLEFNTENAIGYLSSSNADLNMVLCDEFGHILNGGEAQLELRDIMIAKRDPVRQAPNAPNEVRAPDPRSRDRYLVILVNPFLSHAKGGPFKLTIRSGPAAKFGKDASGR